MKNVPLSDILYFTSTQNAGWERPELSTGTSNESGVARCKRRFDGRSELLCDMLANGPRRKIFGKDENVGEFSEDKDNDKCKVCGEMHCFRIVLGEDYPFREGGAGGMAQWRNRIYVPQFIQMWIVNVGIYR